MSDEEDMGQLRQLYPPRYHDYIMSLEFGVIQGVTRTPLASLLGTYRWAWDSESEEDNSQYAGEHFTLACEPTNHPEMLRASDIVGTFVWNGAGASFTLRDDVHSPGRKWRMSILWDEDREQDNPDIREDAVLIVSARSDDNHMPFIFMRIYVDCADAKDVQFLCKKQPNATALEGLTDSEAQRLNMTVDDAKLWESTEAALAAARAEY